MTLFWGFTIALILSAGLTPTVKKLAFRIGAVDQPGEARKIHTRPIARLGGLAIFIAFLMTVLAFLPVSRSLFALLLAAGVLVGIGVVDDIRGVSPWRKLAWQVFAACIALVGGIGITEITNPFGGVINLQAGRFPVELGPITFHITPIANLVSIIWIVGLINVINFLDGLDGLACGVSAISALIMFMLAVALGQEEVALLAVILAGAALGFLPYNFFPARIFMGDSGAYFLGLVLALIAIYSGGKLATVSLVLGFTIIDGVWAVVRRLYRRTSPFSADRGHLHHLMLDAGISQRVAVLSLYGLSVLFGLTALILGSFEKFLSLGILVVTVAILITGLVAMGARRTSGK